MEGVEEAARVGGRKAPAFAIMQGAIVLVHKGTTWKRLAYIVGIAIARKSRRRALVGCRCVADVAGGAAGITAGGAAAVAAVVVTVATARASAAAAAAVVAIAAAAAAAAAATAAVVVIAAAMAMAAMILHGVSAGSLKIQINRTYPLIDNRIVEWPKVRN